MSKNRKNSGPNEKLRNSLFAKSLAGKKGKAPKVLLMSTAELEELKRTKRMPASLRKREPFESKVNPFFTHYAKFVSAKSVDEKEDALKEMEKFSGITCIAPHIKSSRVELQGLKSFGLPII